MKVMSNNMNIQKLIVFFLMLICFFVVNGQSKSSKATLSKNKYIGMKVGHVLPDGFRTGIGSMIDSQYSVRAVNKTKNGSLKMIWFEKLLYQDSSGMPYYEIIDAIDLPKMKKDQFFFIGCLLNDKLDDEIIAIDHWNGEGYYCDNIIHAWRANRKTGKIEIIPVDNIQTRHEFD
jgi:hypothetical protein